MVKPSQIWSDLVKLGQTFYKLVLFGAGNYTDYCARSRRLLRLVDMACFFGMPGSNNDINVLNAPNLFANLQEGCGPPVNYTIMGNHYNMGYYLADGIYPKWATIVQSISHPQELAPEFFANKHESYRKDVERALWVLQARFAIVRGPARFWHHKDLSFIMKAFIILHNMIIEDERVDGTNLLQQLLAMRTMTH